MLGRPKLLIEYFFLYRLKCQHHYLCEERGKSYQRKRKLEILSGLLGNPITSTITKETLAEYRAKRLSQDIKPKTINNEHGYLVAIFNKLIELGKWQGTNTLQGIKKLKLTEKELCYLEESQIATLIRVLEDYDDNSILLMTEVYLSTGARWSEARGLHSRHIKGTMLQFIDTKNEATRWVEIAPELADKLRTRGEGQLFNFRRKWCERQFKQAIQQAGIDLPRGQNTHVLRHTFATGYLANGGDIKTLQSILGHKHLNSTMVYLKVVTAMRAKVVDLNPLARMRKHQAPALKLVNT